MACNRPEQGATVMRRSYLAGGPTSFNNVCPRPLSTTQVCLFISFPKCPPQRKLFYIRGSRPLNSLRSPHKVLMSTSFLLGSSPSSCSTVERSARELQNRIKISKKRPLITFRVRRHSLHSRREIIYKSPCNSVGGNCKSPCT